MSTDSEFDGSDDDWDEDDTVQGANCGRDIYDDAERCPYCGTYLSREDRPIARKPWWIIVGVLLSFAVIYGWIFG